MEPACNAETVDECGVGNVVSASMAWLERRHKRKWRYCQGAFPWWDVVVTVMFKQRMALPGVGPRHLE